MRFYAPVFIFEMLVARLFVADVVSYFFSLSLAHFPICFRLLFLGSSGELVLIYLFLTFAIYIKQTTAHSMEIVTVSCRIGSVER